MWLFSLTLLAAPPVASAEQRGLAYLEKQVPRWSREHRCFSCHHNGDAVRALLAGRRHGFAIKSRALTDSLDWLARPTRWDHNGGEGPFSDKKLSRIQFASTLITARAGSKVHEDRALPEAARLVADLQDPDGGWHVVEAATLGGPTTLGNVLATHLARQVLATDAVRYRGRLQRADRWIRKAPVDTVLDAAAILLALGKADDPETRAQSAVCLDLIRKGEGRHGGWGPYLHSPPEVFDTALVLLALASRDPTPESTVWIRRGRSWLLQEQEADGNWAETTRPTGAESLAQRLSTTGWAVQALLATRAVLAH